MWNIFSYGIFLKIQIFLCVSLRLKTRQLWKKLDFQEKLIFMCIYKRIKWKVWAKNSYVSEFLKFLFFVRMSQNNMSFETYLKKRLVFFRQDLLVGHTKFGSGSCVGLLILFPLIHKRHESHVTTSMLNNRLFKNQNRPVSEASFSVLFHKIIRGSQTVKANINQKFL